MCDLRTQVAYPGLFTVAATSSKFVNPPPSSLNTTASTIIRYGLGILAAVGSLLLRDFLAPFYGERYPYHTAWLAVVFSAWYCGLGPSIVTFIIAAVGVWYWFIPPAES